MGSQEPCRYTALAMVCLEGHIVKVLIVSAAEGETNTSDAVTRVFTPVRLETPSPEIDDTVGETLQAPPLPVRESGEGGRV